MISVSIKELLEAGVHFGHQTKRWNPKMKPFIFGQRNGIYIIDLQKTLRKFREATEFLTRLASEGRTVLFVGTKRQAQEAISEEAQRCEMYYVNLRWLGGLLTNFRTIKRSLDRLQELDQLDTDGKFDHLTKKERIRLEKERVRLEKVLSGIKKMDRLPDALFIVDSRKERIAVREARKLNIPVVAIVDTNCDPDEVDYVIPGNDDAIRAIRLFASRIADSILEGTGLHQSLKQSGEEGKGSDSPAPESGRDGSPHPVEGKAAGKTAGGSAEVRKRRQRSQSAARSAPGQTSGGDLGRRAQNSPSVAKDSPEPTTAEAGKGSAAAE